MERSIVVHLLRLPAADLSLGLVVAQDLFLGVELDCTAGKALGFLFGELFDVFDPLSFEELLTGLLGLFHHFPRSPSLKSSPGGFGPIQQENSASAKALPSIVPLLSPFTSTSVPVPGT